MGNTSIFHRRHYRTRRVVVRVRSRSAAATSHPDLFFLEALDEHGQPVPDGQVGELTATTFGVEAMPLIRYRTGDFAAIYREPCRCGRRTLRIGPIVGTKPPEAEDQRHDDLSLDAENDSGFHTWRLRLTS